jgi:hypothetical protein
MHVVIGSTGMQQGLAFYQLRKLLRVLKVFNSSEILELLVIYAPHIHIQAYNRINSEQNRGIKLLYSSRQSHGHKEY